MEKIVDFTSLTEMLYGETKHIKEFAEAAISSFNEFNIQFNQFLKERNEVDFRKAGHKIKPVAQMLGLQLIVDEYENAKFIIIEEKSDKLLEDSRDRMNSILKRVFVELDEIVKN